VVGAASALLGLGGLPDDTLNRIFNGTSPLMEELP
jgi:hypothetical protein